jgi:hypothetical protein
VAKIKDFSDFLEKNLEMGESDLKKISAHSGKASEQTQNQSF